MSEEQEDTAYQCQSCKKFHYDMDELENCGCSLRVKANKPVKKSVRQANRQHRLKTTLNNFKKNRKK